MNRLLNKLLHAMLPAVATLAVLCAGHAGAQAWPSKPVKLIAVFPPGGSVDTVSRILAHQLTKQTGQQFLVDNKGGASGSIGTAFVAKSPPDGYTFAVVFDTHGVNPSLIPNISYDTLKDLPAPPDLAVIATPADTVTGLIHDAGLAGIRNVVVLPGGFDESSEEGRLRAAALSKELDRFGMRLIGPESFGIMRPHCGLNATLAHDCVRPGSQLPRLVSPASPRSIAARVSMSANCSTICSTMR